MGTQKKPNNCTSYDCPSCNDAACQSNTFDQGDGGHAKRGKGKGKDKEHFCNRKTAHINRYTKDGSFSIDYIFVIICLAIVAIIFVILMNRRCYPL